LWIQRDEKRKLAAEGLHASASASAAHKIGKSIVPMRYVLMSEAISHTMKVTSQARPLQRYLQR
jgi:hypothetical protein